MSIEERLEKLKMHFEFHLKTDESADYPTMMQGVCQELLQLIEMVEHLMKENTLLKKQMNEEWNALQESIQQVCNQLEQADLQSFQLVKGKRYYELLDECMAEVDDCIDDLNEKLTVYHENIPYLESWDIGLFF